MVLIECIEAGPGAEALCQAAGALPAWRSLGFWIDAGTLLVLALTLAVLVITAVYARKAYIQNQEIAERNASFDHIVTQTRDRDLIEMFEEFRLVRRMAGAEDGDGEERVSRDEIERLTIQYMGRAINAADVIKKVFNYYEATAIGIKQRALQEDLIRNWWCSSYIWDWINFARYVYAFRSEEGAGGAFVEYERQVFAWAADRPKERELLMERCREAGVKPPQI